MQDHLVTELRPTRPPAAPVEVVYSLTPDDYVAYWICLSQMAEMPRRAQKAMADAVGVCGGLTWIAGIVLSVPLVVGYPPVGAFFLIATVFGLGLGYSLALSRINSKPSTCFQGRLSKPYRWLCLWALRRLARSEAQEGTLDTQSLYRFTMNAEGFTLTTEPAVPPTDGPSPHREDRVPWSALQHVAFDLEHVFLIIRKGVAAIIPRQGFADPADFERFIALIHCYLKGRDVQPSSSTAICTLEDRLQSHTPR